MICYLFWSASTLPRLHRGLNLMRLRNFHGARKQYLAEPFVAPARVTQNSLCGHHKPLSLAFIFIYSRFKHRNGRRAEKERELRHSLSLWRSKENKHCHPSSPAIRYTAESFYCQQQKSPTLFNRTHSLVRTCVPIYSQI
jgi:hypothetical protein